MNYTDSLLFLVDIDFTKRSTTDYRDMLLVMFKLKRFLIFEHK